VQTITSLGSVSASSTYSAAYPASNAVDGDPTTSWFSAGDKDGPDSTFTWSASGPVVVSTVAILSNARNSDPKVRHGFTFASVTVQVLDHRGAVVAARDAPMQDQDVHVDLGGVTGDTIRLVLHGHTDPTCGGFSELIVRGHPA
jgi:hypothetical protein